MNVSRQSQPDKPRAETQRPATLDTPRAFGRAMTRRAVSRYLVAEAEHDAAYERYRAHCEAVPSTASDPIEAWAWERWTDLANLARRDAIKTLMVAVESLRPGIEGPCDVLDDKVAWVPRGVVCGGVLYLVLLSPDKVRPAGRETMVLASIPLASIEVIDGPDDHSPSPWPSCPN